MWKRLNNSRGTRQPTISGPSPVDSTFDENIYAVSRDSTTVNRKQVPSERNRPPPRPPREDMAPKDLPRLPFEPGPLLQKPDPTPSIQDSTLRPASSLYSQPSPASPATRFSRDQYPANDNEEVSPPSSPEFGARSQAHANAEDDEVSPIDEMPDISTLRFQRPPSRSEGTHPPSSSIPVLRREKKRLAAAAAMANRKEVGGPKGRQAVDPRWDPYSGEITTSEKGKPQSVKPGQFGALGLRPIHKETGVALGTETSISGGQTNNSSFGDRIRKLKSHVPAERPEWKGATGRTALVSPVADQPHVAPLRIPPKNNKRVASPVSSSNSGNSTPVTIIRGGDGETSPVSARQQHTGQNIQSVLGDATTSPGAPIDVTPDPHVVSQSAAARTLARGDNQPKEVLTPPRSNPVRESPPSTIERNFREALKDSFPVPSDPYVQPPSRFSVTTYAPSEAQSTPRPSIDSFEPMPPMPQQSPVINRKRPKVAESPPQISKITRKAVAPGSPVFISMTSSIPGSRRTSNIAKNLPMSPAEAASHDLVTSLQAQLDNLAHRRQNITRSIRQMTELMPKDNVLITEEVRIKREMEKMKVERLRNEEADVRREEHEIGLRLHRAWKRRDKEAVFEPTGLWVRRVTGVGRNWAVLHPNMAF